MQRRVVFGGILGAVLASVTLALAPARAVSAECNAANSGLVCEEVRTCAERAWVRLGHRWWIGYWFCIRWDRTYKYYPDPTKDDGGDPPSEEEEAPADTADGGG